MDVHLNILDGLCGSSVWVNNLLIPPASLNSVLGKYVDSLVTWNDDDTFKVSLIGSAIPLRYRDRYFIVCSQHQLKGRDLSKISIMAEGGKSVITSAGVRYHEKTSNSDADDIAAFDFTEPCHTINNLQSRFFHFDNLPQTSTADNIVYFLSSGFPYEHQRYELQERNHIGLKKLKIVCFPDHIPNDQSLLCIRSSSPIDFNPDGMSGGSSFVVQRRGAIFYASFAGMILRAGNSHFYIMKSEVIHAFLNDCINQEVR